MMRLILWVGMASVLAACQTGSHVTQHYTAEALNANGQVISKQSNLTFNKEGQIFAVQTLCQAQRNTHSVVIKNRLGHQIDGSPFKCR